MSIAVGTDQYSHLHALAADVAHEVAQDREAGNDVELVLRAGGSRRQERRAGDRDHHPASGRHGILLHVLASRQASRWRPGNACRTNPPTRPNNTQTRSSAPATQNIAM